MAFLIEPGRNQTIRTPDSIEEFEQLRTLIENIKTPIPSTVTIYNRTKHVKVQVSISGGNMHILITNEKQDEKFDLEL